MSMIFSGRPLRRLAGATSRLDVEEEEKEKEEEQEEEEEEKETARRPLEVEMSLEDKLAVRAIVAADPLVCVIARMCAWVVRA